MPIFWKYFGTNFLKCLAVRLYYKFIGEVVHYIISYFSICTCFKNALLTVRTGYLLTHHKLKGATLFPHVNESRITVNTKQFWYHRLHCQQAWEVNTVQVHAEGYPIWYKWKIMNLDVSRLYHLQYRACTQTTTFGINNVLYNQHK